MLSFSQNEVVLVRYPNWLVLSVRDAQQVEQSLRQWLGLA